MVDMFEIGSLMGLYFRLSPPQIPVYLFLSENGQSRLELPTRYTCYLNITFSIEQAFEKRIFPLSKGLINGNFQISLCK